MSKRLPALKPKKVIKALERGGFQIRRITGSHYILRKGKQIATVPYHNKDLKPGTLQSILNQAGFSVDDFLELL